MKEMSDQSKTRLEKLNHFGKKAGNPYPNDFKPTAVVQEIHQKYEKHDRAALEKIKESYKIAGRLLNLRSFGKTAFFDLIDRSGKIQGYISKESLGEAAYKDFFDFIDIGDIVGMEGAPFRTKTGELTLKVTSLRLLVKSLHPLPEKWHGLTDVEMRYRKRYLDLIVNPRVREVAKIRSAIIQKIREFFMTRDYLEVETPMMHPIAGGALARPFVTHHNTLDMDLYLRVAPELYLKRLMVGGLDRVFEINRNFRNEGISIQHNPEFTMLEFYEAYATYHDFIDLTEELFVYLGKEILRKEVLEYQGQKISLKRPFARQTFREAILKQTDLKKPDLENGETLIHFLTTKGIDLPVQRDADHLLEVIFENFVEEKLIQPTFITEYPLSISPLSRKNEKNPKVVDRFELYIFGREIANAFSELNDPFDQRERFEAQLEARAEGVREAHEMDEDFIQALEYGMPPAAGEGIGIDRLVMLFTDSASIRDVILFPQLRKLLRDASLRDTSP